MRPAHASRCHENSTANALRRAKCRGYVTQRRPCPERLTGERRRAGRGTHEARVAEEAGTEPEPKPLSPPRPAAPLPMRSASSGVPTCPSPRHPFLADAPGLSELRHGIAGAPPSGTAPLQNAAVDQIVDVAQRRVLRALGQRGPPGRGQLCPRTHRAADRSPRAVAH